MNTKFCLVRYVFIEYDTPEQAAAAIKTKDGHLLDKSHKLRVNRFTDVEKYANAPDVYVEPEIEPYVEKVCSIAKKSARKSLML